MWACAVVKIAIKILVLVEICSQSCFFLCTSSTAYSYDASSMQKDALLSEESDVLSGGTSYINYAILAVLDPVVE